MWRNRRVVNFDANADDLLAKYKIKPFVHLRIALLNFEQAEYQQMSAKIIENDGAVVTLDDNEGECTHLVIRDADNFDYVGALEHVQSIPELVVSEEVGTSTPTHFLLLKLIPFSKQWLTLCLNLMNRQNEVDYTLQIRLPSTFLLGSPLREEGKGPHGLSSILLSPNYDQSIDDSLCSSPCIDKGELKKQAITQELCQTEINYVTILKNIIKVCCAYLLVLIVGYNFSFSILGVSRPTEKPRPARTISERN